MIRKWTPRPLTLILLGLIASLWFRPPADAPASFIVDTDSHIRHKIAAQVHYPRLEKLLRPLLPAALK